MTKNRYVQIYEDDGEPTGATFAAERIKGRMTIRYDSRGTTAGTKAYRRGMILLLQRLSETRLISIHDIAIETQTTQHLSLDDRLLSLPAPYQTPISLDKEKDEAAADALRAAIHTAAARAGRAPGALGGGNGTQALADLPALSHRQPAHDVERTGGRDHHPRLKPAAAPCDAAACVTARASSRRPGGRTPREHAVRNMEDTDPDTSPSEWARVTAPELDDEDWAEAEHGDERWTYVEARALLAYRDEVARCLTKHQRRLVRTGARSEGVMLRRRRPRVDELWRLRLVDGFDTLTPFGRAVSRSLEGDTPK